MESLSPREKEICQEFIKCKGVERFYSTMANRMFVSRSTVQTHFHNIYHKLLINSSTQLMYILMERRFRMTISAINKYAINKNDYELQNMLRKI